jgi:hypothetical protein
MRINIFLCPLPVINYLIQNACPFLNPADFSHERDIRYPENPKGLLIIEKKFGHMVAKGHIINHQFTVSLIQFG